MISHIAYDESHESINLSIYGIIKKNFHLISFRSPNPGSQKSQGKQRSQTSWEGSTGKSYSSSVPMAGLPMAGAIFGVCLGKKYVKKILLLIFIS